MIAVFCDS